MKVEKTRWQSALDRRVSAHDRARVGTRTTSGRSSGAILQGRHYHD